MTRDPHASSRPTLGLAVLAALVVAIAFAAWMAAPMARLALARAAEADSDLEDASTTRFAANLETYTGRFNGRYLFFDPPPPRPEPRPVAREEPDNRPPPPPASYGGPRIVAIFADEVWFADGRRLRVGGEEDGSLRVVSLDSPWSAEVEWRGVNFTVPFIARATVLRPVEPPASSAAEPDPAEPRRAAANEEAGPDAPAAPSTAPAVQAPAPDNGGPPADDAAHPQLQALTAEPPATTETHRQ